MIRFSNGEDSLEIDIVEFGSEQANDDPYVTIRVQSSGFCGANDLWIQGLEFRNFCGGLIEVEKTRRGQVSLRSISPGELDLTIKSVSSLGHFAVIGSIGHRVLREHGDIDHSVAFGFEFDPSQLSAAARTAWVADGAA